MLFHLCELNLGRSESKREITLSSLYVPFDLQSTPEPLQKQVAESHMYVVSDKGYEAVIALFLLLDTKHSEKLRRNSVVYHCH